MEDALVSLDVHKHESKSISQKDLPEMHRRPSMGLCVCRMQVKPEAQTAPGIIFQYSTTNHMRILGITVPENKRLEVALTAIYGIGRSRALLILKTAKVEPGLKSTQLSVDQENDVRKLVESYKIEGDLKREVASNIKRLKDIKAYRGNRHARHLPTRGQRTKTNSRTVRGNVRKTMGSGKRKEEKK